ncbi:hypothetical protein BKA63DRAFT_496371 [Paraphoma chrysanthemicola]|nr:hypothetical protein BKA63DRAFT_496371 [Paraphoma chrysanthemicola]
MAQSSNNQVSQEVAVEEDASNTNVSSQPSARPHADAQQTLPQPHEPWRSNLSSRNTQTTFRPPAGPFSFSASETLCDDEVNAIRAEEWSVPTYTESDVDTNIQSAEKIHLIVRNTRDDVHEEQNLALGQISRLSRALLRPQSFGSSVRAPPLSPTKPDSRGPWSERRTLEFLRDIYAIGSRWQDDLRTSKVSSVTHGSAIPQIVPSYIIQCDNPAIAPSRLSFLLDALNPLVHPCTANNFFNGLDLIIGSLASRFPDDAVVLGLIDAIRLLDRLCIVNFDPFSMSFDRWASADASTTSGSCGAPTDQVQNFLGESSDAVPSHAVGNGTPTPSAPSPPKESSPDQPFNPTIAPVPRDRRKKARGRLLACPVHKNGQLRLVETSCNFSGADTMWAITQHLNSRRHQQDVSFVRVCRTCWTYVTNVTEYGMHHNHGRCLQVTQPRGDRVIAQWYSLYVQLYPYAAHLPSPYIDEATTIPRESAQNRNAALIEPVSAPEFDFNNLPSDQSFLDVHPTAFNDGIQHMSPVFQDSNIDVRPQAEDSAIRLFTQMLGEHVHQSHDLVNHYVDQFMRSAQRMNLDDIDAFADRFYAQANDLMQRLRNQGDPGRPRRYGSTPQDLVLGSSDFWIGQFPVPLHLQGPLPLETPLQLDPPTPLVILPEHVPPAEPWALTSWFGAETGLVRNTRDMLEYELRSQSTSTAARTCASSR